MDCFITEVKEALCSDLIQIIQGYVSFSINSRAILSDRYGINEDFVILHEIKQELDLSYTYVFRFLNDVEESSQDGSMGMIEKKLLFPLEMIGQKSFGFNETCWDKNCFIFNNSSVYFSNSKYLEYREY